MADFFSNLPGHILYLGVSLLLLATAAAITQKVVMRLLPRLFPLRVSTHEREQVGELEKIFEAEIKTLTIVEYLLSVTSMIAMPFLNYKLLVRLLSENALPGDRLLFSGGGAVLFASVVGGALLGPFLTRQYIRARYRATPKLLWLYQRSEDRHGAIGRFLIGNSGLIVACIVVVPTFLVANSYTLVGGQRVEIPHPLKWNERLTLPNEQIVELRVVLRGNTKIYTVRYQDGRLLTSSESINNVGELAAFGRAPREALEYLSEVTGLPVRE